MYPHFFLHKNSDNGFTLIEVVITVAIVALLASVTLPLSELTVKRTKEQELRTALRQIREAIDQYKQAGDEGKIARQADASGYPKSLEDLVKGIEDIKTPGAAKLYFLRRIPRDPFFDDSNSVAEQMWGKRSYSSSAEDPREGEDVYDVYSISSATGINGVPYRDW